MYTYIYLPTTLNQKTQNDSTKADQVKQLSPVSTLNSQNIQNFNLYKTKPIDSK